MKVSKSNIKNQEGKGEKKNYKMTKTTIEKPDKQ